MHCIGCRCQQYDEILAAFHQPCAGRQRSVQWLPRICIQRQWLRDLQLRVSSLRFRWVCYCPMGPCMAMPLFHALYTHVPPHTHREKALTHTRTHSHTRTRLDFSHRKEHVFVSQPTLPLLGRSFVILHSFVLRTGIPVCVAHRYTCLLRDTTCVFQFFQLQDYTGSTRQQLGSRGIMGTTAGLFRQNRAA